MDEYVVKDITYENIFVCQIKGRRIEGVTRYCKALEQSCDFCLYKMQFAFISLNQCLLLRDCVRILRSLKNVKIDFVFHSSLVRFITKKDIKVCLATCRGQHSPEDGAQKI